MKKNVVFLVVLLFFMSGLSFAADCWTERRECSACSGMGAFLVGDNPNISSSWKKCSVCNGKTYVMKKVCLGGGDGPSGSISK